MKNPVLVFVLCFTFLSTAYAQVKFEPGYVIERDGEKIECFIKNQDWRANPNKISYRIGESDSVRTGSPASIAEFKVTGFARYVAADVKIDRSSSTVTSLPSSRNPVWSQEMIFLKVLVEGKGVLYCLNGNNIQRFFYSVDDSPIEQLIYKEYRSGRHVAKNNTYQSQLSSNAACSGSHADDLKSVGYFEGSLVKYFKKYNACQGVTQVIEEGPAAKRNVFNLKVFGGASSSSLGVVSEITGRKPVKYRFGSEISPRIGVQAEIILPFHKNKWGILFEPSYQTYSSEINEDSQTLIDYKFIELSLGLRHYFFLNENNQLFLDVHFIPGTRGYLKKELVLSGNDFNIEQNVSVSVGMGFQHGRVSTEFRFYKKTNVMDDYFYYLSEYRRTSLIVGYRLAKVNK